MKRTNVTYGQLDTVLHSFGFTCRVVRGKPPTRVYDHQATGAIIMMPPFPERDRVFAHHLIAARITVDGFGIAEASMFDAKLTMRTKVTYGQLFRVLRSLGFSCHHVKNRPPTVIYEHKDSGAYFVMPPMLETDLVFDYHLFTARTIAELFGLIDAKSFDARLKEHRSVTSSKDGP